MRYVVNWSIARRGAVAHIAGQFSVRCRTVQDAIKKGQEEAAFDLMIQDNDEDFSKLDLKVSVHSPMTMGVLGESTEPLHSIW